jgi:SNF2 family DNA or RNA helicase
LVQAIRARSFGNPQIIAQDANGNPMFRNLEKLRALMAPVTYRVTKEECLDLPEKIYQTHYFELTAAQRRLYNTVRDEMRYEREDGEIDIYTALTMINKLRQITSGFIMVEGKPTNLKEAKPRLEALNELVEDAEKPLIVWGSFREELRKISELLSSHRVVEYHGGVGRKDRETAIDQFQSGDADIFIGNPAAAGVGLTLTAARTVIYYSCSFSLEERQQSEDRCHRIGTDHHVVYYDLVARETIDERIASALQAKAQTALQILEGL